jgi:hypothetical protein
LDVPAICNKENCNFLLKTSGKDPANLVFTFPNSNLKLKGPDRISATFQIRLELRVKSVDKVDNKQEKGMWETVVETITEGVT